MIAFSNALEVVNQIIIAHELGYLKTDDYQSLRKEMAELTNKLNALRKAQINK